MNIKSSIEGIIRFNKFLEYFSDRNIIFEIKKQKSPGIIRKFGKMLIKLRDQNQPVTVEASQNAQFLVNVTSLG